MPRARGGCYLCEAGQIYESEVENVGGVDLQVNGLSIDALVAARHSCRFVFDLALDIGEVAEPSVGHMVELGPFRAPGDARGPVRVGIGIGYGLISGDVDELED